MARKFVSGPPILKSPQNNCSPSYLHLYSVKCPVGDFNNMLSSGKLSIDSASSLSLSLHFLKISSLACSPQEKESV